MPSKYLDEAVEIMKAKPTMRLLSETNMASGSLLWKEASKPN